MQQASSSITSAPIAAASGAGPRSRPRSIRSFSRASSASRSTASTEARTTSVQAEKRSSLSAPTSARSLGFRVSTILVPLLLVRTGGIGAALPQHSSDQIANLPGAVEISAVGVAGRVIVAGQGDIVATVESDAPTLVRWITQRGSWDELGVKATGDEQALAVARTFKVY